MSDLEKLEFHSLVTKITKELNNHYSIADPVVAEFIIDLHAKSPDFKTFTQQLSETGCDFPESFVQRLDHLIVTLGPKSSSAAPNRPHNQTAEAKDFPGLALPDTEPVPATTTVEPSASTNDPLAQLEGLLQSTRAE
ncbi:hypothetical protein BJ085DRAFT_39697, partial [Dimargaris cristalligena]